MELFQGSSRFMEVSRFGYFTLQRPMRSQISFFSCHFQVQTDIVINDAQCGLQCVLSHDLTLTCCVTCVLYTYRGQGTSSTRLIKDNSCQPMCNTAVKACYGLGLKNLPDPEKKPGLQVTNFTPNPHLFPLKNTEKFTVFFTCYLCTSNTLCKCIIDVQGQFSAFENCFGSFWCGSYHVTSDHSVLNLH